MKVGIVNAGYSSTNYWVVGSGPFRVIVDLGYPGTMAQMRAQLERKNVPMGELKYALATHYHIDHAGCAQDFKNAGVPLLVIEGQAAAIPLMKRHIKPRDAFTDIVPHDNVVVQFAETRALLARIGVAGEVLPTPGHSDDSVSLLLDSGEAFTGDLTLPMMATENAMKAVMASWSLLRDRGASTIYPGHGNSYPLTRLALPDHRA